RDNLGFGPYIPPRGQGKYRMLRCRVPEGSFSAQHTSGLPRYGRKPMQHSSRLHRMGAVLLCMLSLTWTTQRVMATEASGFSQDSRAVVLHPTVLATVAHALTPDVVEVHVAQQASVQTVPLRVTSMTAMARTAPDVEGVPAQVAHVNTPYDLALAQTDKNQL